MRPFFFAIVLSAVILTTGIGQNAELSVPPDVAISNWLPLGEPFGFVIVSAGKQQGQNRQHNPLCLGSSWSNATTYGLDSLSSGPGK
jgi:hypothetical protein